MGNRLIIEAPAKVNLTLDIKSKRPDGYHELETIMHQIDLFDRIFLRPRKSGIELDTDCSSISKDKENLAYQAAEAILSRYGAGEGIEVFIEKNIPIGAGLAGGSTDAAAVLLGISKIYNYNLPLAKLMKIAEEIGSDVPFCLLGTELKDNRLIRQGATALARGRGEILIPLEAGITLEMILVKPDLQISTAEVYQKFRFDKVKNYPDTKAFIEAWTRCDIINTAARLGNVLESVSTRKHPEILKIKGELLGAGALNAVMSGSGPSVLGVFASRKQACKAMEKLKKKNRETYLVSSYIRGD